MEVFLNISQALVDMNQTDLIRLDMRYNNKLNDFVAYAYYADGSMYEIAAEGYFWRRKEVKK